MTRQIIKRRDIGGMTLRSSQDFFPFVERWLSKPPGRHVGFFCLLAVLSIGYVDYLLGTNINLSVVYAIPISAAALFVGTIPALGLALLSVMISQFGDYLFIEHAAPMRYPYVPPPGYIWVTNGTLRLLFFAFLVVVLARLHRLHTDLEQRAQERAVALARETAERERLEHEMLEISEREQRRIGRDLHDGLCQHLTGTALASHVLAEKLGAKSLPEAQGARHIVDLLEEGIGLARSMAKGLHPVEMQAGGLMEALEEFAATTSELFGIQCRFECQTPVLIHTPATATHLYRIAQEAVGNAIKHGKATHIVIMLEETETGLRLAVLDNGRGLAVSARSTKGMGLRIMADRAKMIGATFAVRAHNPHGVELSCLLHQTEPD
jgi:signal transduction histidine kinase